MGGADTAIAEGNRDDGLKPRSAAHSRPPLGGWLGPTWGEGLRFGIDADQVEAVSEEREALWRRFNDGFPDA